MKKLRTMRRHTDPQEEETSRSLSEFYQQPILIPLKGPRETQNVGHTNLGWHWSSPTDKDATEGKLRNFSVPRKSALWAEYGNTRLTGSFIPRWVQKGNTDPTFIQLAVK